MNQKKPRKRLINGLHDTINNRKAAERMNDTSVLELKNNIGNNVIRAKALSEREYSAVEFAELFDCLDVIVGCINAIYIKAGGELPEMIISKSPPKPEKFLAALNGLDAEAEAKIKTLLSDTQALFSSAAPRYSVWAVVHYNEIVELLCEIDEAVRHSANEGGSDNANT